MNCNKCGEKLVMGLNEYYPCDCNTIHFETLQRFNIIHQTYETCLKIPDDIKDLVEKYSQYVDNKLVNDGRCKCCKVSKYQLFKFVDLLKRRIIPIVNVDSTIDSFLFIVCDGSFPKTQVGFMINSISFNEISTLFE